MNDLLEQPAQSKEVAVADDQPPSILNIIANAARDPAVDVVKLEALLRMQRDVMADDAKAQFTRALHLAQSELGPVEKNGKIKLIRDGKDLGTIPFATFEDMSRALKPIMERHGFTISFDMAAKTGDGGGAVISGLLTHSAGHSRSASIPLALDAGPGRNNLQAMGSTLSYGKRYLCEMFFNIVRKGVDDDGKTGGTRLITAEQIRQIESLLTETGADRTRFLATMSVENVSDIEAGAYNVAINLLSAKRARQAAK